MYEFGDYGDYRASNTGSDNSNGYGFLLFVLILGLPIGFFAVYFIGCFLWLSLTR